MKEIEIWKDVIGYENLYQISSLGRIKSLGNGGSNSKERILRQSICKKYCYVKLSKEGKKKTFRVHKLVAMTFIPNPQNLPIINHKDENSQNNCASNLEWCTIAYNNNYGLHNERVTKARQKPILQFSKSGNIILHKWESTKQAGKELNINRGHICECLKGKIKTCGGYKWKYLQDYINEQIQYLNELKAYKERLRNILKNVS